MYINKMYVQIHGKRYKVYSENGEYFIYKRPKVKELVDQSDVVDAPYPKKKKINSDISSLVEQDKKLRKNIKRLKTMLKKEKASKKRKTPSPQREEVSPQYFPSPSFVSPQRTDIEEKLRECKEAEEHLKNHITYLHGTTLQNLMMVVNAYVDSGLLDDTSYIKVENAIRNHGYNGGIAMIHDLHAEAMRIIQQTKRSLLEQLSASEDRFFVQKNELSRVASLLSQTEQLLTACEKRNGELLSKMSTSSSSEELERLKLQYVEEMRIKNDEFELKLTQCSQEKAVLSSQVDVLGRKLSTCDQDKEKTIKESQRLTENTELLLQDIEDLKKAIATKGDRDGQLQRQLDEKLRLCAEENQRLTHSLGVSQAELEALRNRFDDQVDMTLINCDKDKKALREQIQSLEKQRDDALLVVGGSSMNEELEKEMRVKIDQYERDIDILNQKLEAYEEYKHGAENKMKNLASEKEACDEKLMDVNTSCREHEQEMQRMLEETNRDKEMLKGTLEEVRKRLDESQEYISKLERVSPKEDKHVIENTNGVMEQKIEQLETIIRKIMKEKDDMIHRYEALYKTYQADHEYFEQTLNETSDMNKKLRKCQQEKDVLQQKYDQQNSVIREMISATEESTERMRQGRKI